MDGSIKNVEGGILVVLVISILTLAGLAGGGYWAYGKYFQTKPRLKLNSVKVKPEVMEFLYRFIPKAHALAVVLDDDITLMDSEIKRLEAIAKKFPEQKALISEQLQRIEKTRRKTAAELNSALEQINTIYVSWLIDPIRGKKVLLKKRLDLIKSMAALRKSSAKLMARLRANAQRAGGKS